MRELSFDEFSGREGETFELVFGERSLPLTLTDAQALPYSGREGGAFVLSWLGPYEPVAEQGIYTFRQGDKTFEIFIVPIAQSRDGARYEAVFN
jgi:hypothetical protein